MEAGGSIADMISVAQRDRQDSANSLELAARSATLFGAASSGGSTADAGNRLHGPGPRFRTASSNGVRQQSDAAALGLLERQVAAAARRQCVTFAWSQRCILPLAVPEPRSLNRQQALCLLNHDGPCSGRLL
jgi:hypothetical protein